jgi:hypothetical protein
MSLGRAVAEMRVNSATVSEKTIITVQKSNDDKNCIFDTNRFNPEDSVGVV